MTQPLHHVVGASAPSSHEPFREGSCCEHAESAHTDIPEHRVPVSGLRDIVVMPFAICNDCFWAYEDEWQSISWWNVPRRMAFLSRRPVLPYRHRFSREPQNESARSRPAGAGDQK